MAEEGIKVKLPKEVKGEELAYIIEESINALEGYRIKTSSDGYYEPGSVKFVEEVKHIEGHKKLRSFLNILDGLACGNFPEYKIDVSLKVNEPYEELHFRVKTRFGKVDSRTLQSRPDLKNDFENLIRNVYTRLNNQNNKQEEKQNA